MTQTQLLELTDVDQSILHILEVGHPFPMIGADVARLAEVPDQVPIGHALNELRKRGLVEIPSGPELAWRITQAGIETRAR